jgi:hypothetical protein
MKKLLIAIFIFCSFSTFAQTASVTLTATATVDPKAAVSTYDWSQISGPAQASYSDSVHNVLTANFTLAGNYSFTCTVTDNKGQQASYTAYVTVSPYSYIKPTVIITPSSTAQSPIMINLK